MNQLQEGRLEKSEEHRAGGGGEKIEGGRERERYLHHTSDEFFSFFRGLEFFSSVIFSDSRESSLSERVTTRASTRCRGRIIVIEV
jgi:hypothetical protein